MSKGAGWIYAITNPSIPNRVKIGLTRKMPYLRAREMFVKSTGVPLPYDVYYQALHPDPEWLENTVHETLARKRDDDREWFSIEPNEAVGVIQDCADGHLLFEHSEFTQVPDPTEALEAERHKAIHWFQQHHQAMDRVRALEQEVQQQQARAIAIKHDLIKARAEAAEKNQQREASQKAGRLMELRSERQRCNTEQKIKLDAIKPETPNTWFLCILSWVAIAGPVFLIAGPPELPQTNAVIAIVTLFVSLVLSAAVHNDIYEKNYYTQKRSITADYTRKINGIDAQIKAVEGDQTTVAQRVTSINAHREVTAQ